MMDTVLNLGLNDETVPALAAAAGDPRFAYDSYRRFIQMYSDVVMGLDHHAFEEILEEFKNEHGRDLDTDLTADDWQQVIASYKALVEDELGTPFPQDPHEQLWGAIGAVFLSWESARAITYRRLHDIPNDWARRSTCRRWSSATWERTPPPALPLPATRPPAKRRSTASS